MTLRNDHSSRTLSEIVPSSPPSSPTRDPQEPYRPAWLQAADAHTLPVSPPRLRATLAYAFDPWYRVPKALAILMGRGVRGCWYECGYTISGGLRVIDAVYSFGAALHHEQGVALALGTNHQYRAKERHINARRARGILIGAALAAMSILGLWLGFHHPYAGGLAGFGLAATLDTIGRRGRAPREKPVRKPQAFKPGMPGAVLWGQITSFLTEQKLDPLIQVYGVRPEVEREAYHVDVRTQVEIKPEMLRALERWIHVRDGACQLSTCPTNSADKTITIQQNYPLRRVQQAPWIPAGSVSGWQPLDLGETSNREQPFELVLVMQHIMLISRNRGGKTTHIHNIIDRLSACRDVVLCAAALVKSAAFDSWRSVLHKKAYSVAELEDLLNWALDEIDRRDQMLIAINSDDDPSNDVEKWNNSLGPAIVLLIDEWPEASEYDGTKYAGKDYKPNIVGLVKRITRTGAGLGVSVILSVQASGNQDWGSSVLNKQTNIKIMGPCTEDDTVAVLGKDKRDQGYAPHLLRPADENNPNDAGMAVVDGPGFGPDYVRGYAPFAVKARAIKREREWAKLGNRPELPDNAVQPAVTYINAETIPDGLAAVDMALTHHSALILSTELVIQYANAHGGRWTATSLSAALRKEIPGNENGEIIKPRDGRCEEKRKVLKCYYRTNVDQALAAIEGPE